MYQFALFVHFTALVLAFFATGLLAGGMGQLRRAQAVRQARAGAMQASRAAKMHPIAIVLLFISGAYMTQAQWTWSTPWIDCGIAGLLAVAVLGGGVLGGRGRALERVLHETPGETITPEIRKSLDDPVMNAGGPAISIFVLAIVLLMIAKPELPGALLILAGGALAGALLGTAMLRRTLRPQTIP